MVKWLNGCMVIWLCGCMVIWLNGYRFKSEIGNPKSEIPLNPQSIGSWFHIHPR
jgi:hypothetical protein